MKGKTFVAWAWIDDDPVYAVQRSDETPEGVRARRDAMGGTAPGEGYFQHGTHARAAIEEARQ